ncbi:hypothetical protein LCL97_15455 [Seohaeicola saemankumensis]|nr:hypothetical protein [Seohaeicola saemankumensis]MCA0872231.1 hypothetical protein [Seohaeicola saemankumensis]
MTISKAVLDELLKGVERPELLLNIPQINKVQATHRPLSDRHSSMKHIQTRL